LLTSALKVSTYVITSFSARPIRFAGNTNNNVCLDLQNNVQYTDKYEYYLAFAFERKLLLYNFIACWTDSEKIYVIERQNQIKLVLL
jgi:hypothetical protein